MCFFFTKLNKRFYTMSNIYRLKKLQPTSITIIQLTKTLSKRYKKKREEAARIIADEAKEYKPGKNIKAFYDIFGDDVELYRLCYAPVEIADTFSRIYTSKALATEMKAMAGLYTTTIEIVSPEDRTSVLIANEDKTINSRHPFTACFLAVLYDRSEGKSEAIAREYLPMPMKASYTAVLDEYRSKLARFPVTISAAALDRPSKRYKDIDTVVAGFEYVLRCRNKGVQTC